MAGIDPGVDAHIRSLLDTYGSTAVDEAYRRICASLPNDSIKDSINGTADTPPSSNPTTVAATTASSTASIQHQKNECPRDAMETDDAQQQQQHSAYERIAQSILDSAFDAIVLIDDQGRIDKVNQRTLTMFGYDAIEELVNGRTNISQLVGDATHAANHDEYLKKFHDRGGDSTVLGHKRELMARRKDGTLFPCQIGIQKVPNTVFVVGYVRDVTMEKSQVESILKEKESVQENERITQSILDSSFDAVVLIDDQGSIERVNKSTLTMFGYASADELIHTNIRVLVGDETHAANHDNYLRNFYNRSGDSSLLGHKRDLMARRKDGTLFPCQIGIQKVPNTKFVVGYVHDVTLEKSQVESILKEKESVQENERITQSILDSSFDAVVLIDDQGSIERVNKSTLTMFGYESVEELIHTNIRVLVGDETHAANHDTYLKNFYNRSGDSSLLGLKRDLMARRKDGTLFPCQVGIQKVPNTKFVVGYVHDVTVEKSQVESIMKEKESVQENERITQSILDSSFDAVVLIDDQGRIERVNQRTVTMFGYDAVEELIDANIRILVGDETHAANHDTYLKNFYNRSGNSSLLGHTRDLMARRKDGTLFPCQIGIQKVPDTKFVVGYVHDVTLEKAQVESIMKEKELVQENERITQSILDSSFDAVILIDDQGLIERANQRTLSMFGYDSVDQLINANIRILVGDETHAANHDKYLKNFYNRSGGSSMLGLKRDLMARRKDGTLFPCQIGIQKVPNTKFVVGYVHDVTMEKSQVESILKEKELVQENERITQSILDSSFDAVVLIDDQGRIERVNQRTVSMFGYDSVEDLIDANIRILVGDETHAANHDKYLKNFYNRSGASSVLGHTRDLMARRKDGTLFPCRIGIQKVPNTKFVVGYVHDATLEKSQVERILKEKELVQEHERITQSILDSSFDAVVLIDDKGCIERVNERTLSMFGYDCVEELMNSNIRILVGDETHAANHDDYLRNFQNRSGNSSVLGRKRELMARRKDGTLFPCQIGIQKVPATKFVVGYVRDVSMEKQQVESIKAKERITQSILDSSFDAVILIDDSGCIQRVNASTLNMFGFDSAAELIKKNISSLVGDETHAANHDFYLKRFYDKGGESRILGQKRELMAKRKDGSLFPCQIGIQKVPNTEFVVGFIHDVSFEKQQLEAINEKERLTQSLLDSSFDAIILIDDQGRIQRVNASATRIFKFENANEIVGMNISTLVGDPEHAAKHDGYLRRFFQNQGKSSVLGKTRDLTAKRHDGTIFACQIGIEKVPDTDYLVGYVRDVSLLKKQMEDIQEKERITQSILDSAFDAIVLIDDRGCIQRVNRSTLTIFGYDKNELEGRNISCLVGDTKHAMNHDSYLKKFKEKGGTSSILGKKRELLAKRKCGSLFPCQLGIRKVPNTSFVVGYVRDVTIEKKNMKLTLEKRNAENLLFNMLPKEIASRLQRDPTHIADHFEQATVLFADIVGFTKMSNTMSPINVVSFLNDIFSRFDENLDRYGLNKVKTIGDAYMVTSIPNCMDPLKSCAAVCHFAMDMEHELEDYNKENPGQPLAMRIGINTGPVVAGVVGTRRFLYDIWGDAVNIASRMESTGVPGKVQVTQKVVDSVPGDEFEFQGRGRIAVKGIGDMETFLIASRNKDNVRKYWGKLRRIVSNRSWRAETEARRPSSILELLELASQLDAE